MALFAQCLEEGGPVEPRTREERCACNPTYRATAAALKKLDRRVLTVLAAAEAVLNDGERLLPSSVLYFRAARLGKEWGKRTYYATIGANSFFK